MLGLGYASGHRVGNEVCWVGEAPGIQMGNSLTELSASILMPDSVPGVEPSSRLTDSEA